MKRKVIIGICLFLVITNVPPVRVFLDIFLSPAYKYTTKSRAFQDEEIHYAGGKYEDVIRAYNRYATSFNASDDTLCRTFEMKPYKFWLWGQYLLHPKYRLPYLKLPEGHN